MLELFERNRRELEFLRNYTHPNIVRFFDGRVDKNYHQLLIFEQCESISNRLQSQDTPDALKREWMRQVVCVMAELQKCSIVHRDLKMENLMLKDGLVKLIDFGQLKQESADRAFSTKLLDFGTLMFSPPEGTHEELERGADAWASR